MSVVDTPNWDLVAQLLGVDRATLPTDEVAPPLTETARATTPGFTPLSDEEFSIIQEFMPKLPVPKTAEECDDLRFLNASLWFIVARGRGHSWFRLPPQYGPQTSRQGRFSRWSVEDRWLVLYENLRTDGRLSPTRLWQFEQIAAFAATQKAKILAGRE